MWALLTEHFLAAKSLQPIYPGKDIYCKMFFDKMANYCREILTILHVLREGKVDLQSYL